MSSFLILTVLLTSLLSPAIGYVVTSPHHRHRHGHLLRHIHPQEQNNSRTNPSIVETPLLRARNDLDPTDFSWVKTLAAVGDSFTAGIGAGNILGTVFHQKEDWLCSRYDLSYPRLINGVIGPSVDNFQFPACSGARSGQILEQVVSLKEDIDLAIMTAGGNDLCLVSQYQTSFLILGV